MQRIVHPDFRPVAEILERQVARHQPGGAAVTVYHFGECVVDTWAGSRNRAGDPWQQDTMAVSFSTTKGVASTLVHALASDRVLDYDTPIATYWPEFARNGKGAITLRQVMAHEAGLYRIADMIDDAHRILDWEFMVRALENATPAHPPGAANAYHGLTYGWLVGEVIRRATGLSFAKALATRIAAPLGLDGCYCGLPEAQRPRVAELIGVEAHEPTRSERRRFFFFNLLLRALSFGQLDLRPALAALAPAKAWEIDYQAWAVQSASIPAANGVFTARSLARIYSALASGGSLGRQRLLRSQTVACAATIQNRRRDRVLLFAPRWRLGFHRVLTLWGPACNGFGHAGFGGSGGWADPDRQLAMGLVLNSGVGTPLGDGRIVELTRAVLRCADRRDGEIPTLSARDSLAPAS